MLSMLQLGRHSILSPVRDPKLYCLVLHLLCTTRTISTNRAASVMDNIPEVEIDDGKFKYIQIKLSDGSGKEKLIVRGYKSAGYHADILERVEDQYKGLQASCPGGGRILHVPAEKKINVYGYSMGFGRADHQLTCEILRRRYPDYEITFSNEGY